MANLVYIYIKLNVEGINFRFRNCRIKKKQMQRIDNIPFNIHILVLLSKTSTKKAFIYFFKYVHVHCTFPGSTQKWTLITVDRTWPGVTFVRQL